MSYEVDYKELYATLSTTEKQKFHKAFDEIIASVVAQVSQEDKYRLSLYLLRRMLKAGRQKR